MEIQGKNGSKTLLEEGVSIDFGRGLGLDSDDRTVSRRHIAFNLHKSNHKDANATKVGFVVTGRNPVWVYRSSNGEIRVYRRSESGEMENGDLFCVSAKNPVWFSMRRRIEFESRELAIGDDLAEMLQSCPGLPEDEDLEAEAVDLSNIDPIKEFGFIVMGHEFDGYPKKMMRDSKNWDWFLEEGGEKSDSDEDGDRKRKKGTSRNRKKGGNGDVDDDWAGESEDDAEVITKLRKVQKPKYSTRSKDHDKGTSVGKKPRQKDVTQTKEIDEDDDDDEDEDETLGDFIVDDEGAEEEKEIDEDEEEEEFEEEEEEEDEEE